MSGVESGTDCDDKQGSNTHDGLEMSDTDCDVKQTSDTHDELEEMSDTDCDAKQMSDTHDGLEEISDTHNGLEEMSDTDCDAKQTSDTHDGLEEMSDTDCDAKQTSDTHDGLEEMSDTDCDAKLISDTNCEPLTPQQSDKDCDAKQMSDTDGGREEEHSTSDDQLSMASSSRHGIQDVEMQETSASLPCHVMLDNKEVARYFSAHCRAQASITEKSPPPARRRGRPPGSAIARPPVIPSGRRPGRPPKTPSVNPLVSKNPPVPSGRRPGRPRINILQAPKFLECNVCQHRVKLEVELRRHKACAHDTEIICKLCFKFFESKTLLEEHKCAFKNNGNYFSCDFCFKMYDSKDNLTRHAATCHAEMSRSSLDFDMQSDSAVSSSNQGPGEGDVKREKSESDSSDIEILNDRTEVGNIKISNVVSNSNCVCGICGKVTARPHDHRKHMARVHSLEPYCSGCSKVFDTKAHLNLHQCTKTKKKRNDQKDDVTCIDLLAQINKQEAAKTTNKKSIQQTVSSCSNCQTLFGNKESFENHLCKVTHGVCLKCNSREKISELVDLKSNKYCKPCAAMIKSNINVPLQSNVRLKCNLCNKELASKVHVKYHMQFVHKNVPYCDVCDTFFNSASDFQLHCNVFHNSNLSVTSGSRINASSKPAILLQNSGAQTNTVPPEIVMVPHNSVAPQSLLTPNVAQSMVSQSFVAPELVLVSSNTYPSHSSLISQNSGSHQLESSMQQHSEVAPLETVAPELVMVPPMNCEPEVIGISDDEEEVEEKETSPSLTTNKFEFVMLDESDGESLSLKKDNFDCKSQLVVDYPACKICKAELKNISSVKRHIRNVHGKKDFCIYCWTDVSRTTINLQNHYRTCVLYAQCKEREKELGDTGEVSEKQNTSVPVVKEALFSCSHCNINFLSELDHKIHMNLSHNGTYLVCHYCRIEFANMQGFVLHIHTCDKSKRSTDTQLLPPPPVPVINDVMHIKEHTFNSI